MTCERPPTLNVFCVVVVVVVVVVLVVVVVVEYTFMAHNMKPNLDFHVVLSKSQSPPLLASSPLARAMAPKGPKASLHQPAAEPFPDPALARSSAVGAEEGRAAAVKQAVQNKVPDQPPHKAPIARRPPRPPPRMKRRAQQRAPR